ncbi:MAG TPA: deoxyguanosinetriphosphate triphosphohydrolase, partial [Terriglobia bacterium]|nr:deoxyguanosinetriphosphate triphosphohydrolase [Terriglobia bacterium]
LDDAVRSGLIGAENIPKDTTVNLGNSHSVRINTLVQDVIYSSLANDLETISMTPGILQAMLDLRGFLYKAVYTMSIPRSELEKAKKMLSDIYHYILEHPETFIGKSKRGGDSVERAATDFVAGMTDRFAINLYRQLFLPQAWNHV